MFSTESLILQLSYALLIAAVLARTPRRMRLLVAAAGLVTLVHAAIAPPAYPAIIWMALLLGAWLLMLWADHHQGTRMRFSDAEEAMRRTYLAGLPRGAARQFIDQGLWLRGQVGDQLTCEGAPVANLYYLVSGEACVISQGRQVGICRAGDLIGEATILSGDAATASVTVSAPAEFWCAPTPALRRFLDDHEGLRSAIERSFSNAVKEKLRAANLAIARRPE